MVKAENTTLKSFDGLEDQDIRNTDTSERGTQILLKAASDRRLYLLCSPDFHRSEDKLGATAECVLTWSLTLGQDRPQSFNFQKKQTPAPCKEWGFVYLSHYWLEV